jgi:hypothetical protein
MSGPPAPSTGSAGEYWAVPTAVQATALAHDTLESCDVDVVAGSGGGISAHTAALALLAATSVAMTVSVAMLASLCMTGRAYSFPSDR